jgi:tetratricopeptide (TPR) repeat protein
MGFSLFKSKGREKKNAAPLPSGRRRERSSNPQVSIKLAEHFLRENKRDLAVEEYLNAAQAFLEKRQAQLAMAVYRNIITIDPERYGIYETLADLYRMSGFPGDGASTLLALAYQYQKAGHHTEVRRVLDAVLEFAPDNRVLKRKVEAFIAHEGRPGDAAPKTPAPKPAAPAQPAPVSADIFAPPAAPVRPGTDAPALKPGEPPRPTPSLAADIFAPPPAPEPATASAEAAVQHAQPPAQVPSCFDLKSALAEDLPGQEETAAPAGACFDLRSALSDDFSARHEMADTAEPFFDLQSALEADPGLRFDYDASSDDGPAGEDGSLPSVLNVVKNIAVQDPRQDTPLFHFNLGIAYMQCADYEQAVDELLSALYGIPDKIGCYVRLAECSLKLQRRELACGFLREALDHPDIRPEQARTVRNRLDEMSAP